MWRSLSGIMGDLGFRVQGLHKKKTNVQGVEIASLANGLFRLNAVPYLSLGFRVLGFGLWASLQFRVRG